MLVFLLAVTAFAASNQKHWMHSLATLEAQQGAMSVPALHRKCWPRLHLNYWILLLATLVFLPAAIKSKASALSLSAIPTLIPTVSASMTLSHTGEQNGDRTMPLRYSNKPQVFSGQQQRA